MNDSGPSTFYQRPLPRDLVAFASEEGRGIFREALAEGHMESFFALAEQFHTQADPAFCGLGSLVVVLNALGIDPGRLWKGPWRWFSEELLDCCAPLDDVRAKGITMDELACLARCNGAEVRVERALASDVDAFRAEVREAARTPRAPLLVVSYDRATLGQTGSGHFSPIGGYHAARDLVLLLDVARFKYPPHWVPLTKLFAATRTTDTSNGASRGWIVLRPRQTPRSVLYALSPEAHVGELVAGTRRRIAEAFAAPPADATSAIATFARAVAGAASALELRVHAGETESARANELLAELRATELHRAIRGALGEGAAAPGPADVAAALAMVMPDATWGALPEGVRADVVAMLEHARAAKGMTDETATLREQLSALSRYVACRAEREDGGAVAPDRTRSRSG